MITDKCYHFRHTAAFCKKKTTREKKTESHVSFDPVSYENKKVRFVSNEKAITASVSHDTEKKYEKYTGYFENPSFANRLYLPAYDRQCKIKESPQSVLIIRIIVTCMWRRQSFCGDSSPQRLRGCSSQNSAPSVSCDTKIN